MKKVLFVLLMCLVASAASAIEIPDPVIIVTDGDEYYTVNVVIDGDYELRVFCDNTEIEIPYAIEVLEEEQEYVIRAYAQLHNEDGWFYSNVVEYWLWIPARETPPVPGPYPPGWINFSVTEGDEYYTVLAYCEEDDFTVRLWSDGVPVDNPYIIERSPDGDMEYYIAAESHGEGYETISASMILVVPGLEKPVRGDLNGDGEVGIADVNAVIDAILNENSEEIYDFDGDGEVTISDVMALLNYVLSGS